MKKIKINTKDFFFPENWNELSPEQLRFLSRISFENIPVQDIRLKMVLFCLKAKIIRYKNNRYTIYMHGFKFQAAPEGLIALSDIFDFLFSEPDKQGNRYIDSRLSKNPFPLLKISGHRLIGPADALTDITYEQFIYLQTFSERISSDQSAIDALIEIIYKRPCGKSATGLIRKIPADIKMIIFWLYTGSIRFIASKYHRVFSGNGESLDNAFEAQQKVIHSLANGELTKKDQVRNSLLYDALYTMELNIEQQEELEAKMKL